MHAIICFLSANFVKSDKKSQILLNLGPRNQDIKIKDIVPTEQKHPVNIEWDEIFFSVKKGTNSETYDFGK